MEMIMLNYKLLSEVYFKEDKEMYLLQSNEDSLFYFLKIYHDNYNYPLINRVKSLHCENTPEIKELYIKDDSLYVIEKFINGPTLKYLINNQSFSEQEAVNIIIQLCDIMNLYHSNNPPIIHRDLAWDNILYKEGKVYVIDFDIARFYDEEKNEDTDALGKRNFVPPEQREEYPGQTTPASDIYAMGIIFHLLLTGMFPRECTYNGKYQDIIKRMTRKEIEDRYQSTIEVKRALYIYSGNLRGYFIIGNNKKHFIEFFVVLLYILLVIFGMEFEDANTYEIILYKTYFILAFIQPVLLATNFNNCKVKCLFSTNNSKLVRIIGQVITSIIVLFIEIMIIAYIAVFFE